MDCDVAREALSARIDGEREPVPSTRVDEHLEGCSGCREWYFRARALTGELRELAGQHRPSMAVVNGAGAEPVAIRRGVGDVRWRCLLAVVGVIQAVLAVLQAAGLGMGVPVTVRSDHAPMMGGHLVNESTAWSVAIGLAMIVAAARPVAAVGLGAVLVVFTLVLGGYVVADAVAGAVTAGRVLSHIPALLGSILTVLVWRYSRRPTTPSPRSRYGDNDDVVLPKHASRGRSRGHLWPTDGSAA